MSLWVYRGEGNEHIVVSNEQKHIVYRMFKRTKDAQKKLKRDYEAMCQTVQHRLEFSKNIMLPRFHRDYFHCGSLVKLPEAITHSIRNILVNRPVYREDKELDVDCPYALQMPDYCYVDQRSFSSVLSRGNHANGAGSPRSHISRGCVTNHHAPSWGTSPNKPVYTVEIKPKWGFLPITKNISEHKKIKHSVCRFCLHQHIKLAKGKWLQQSRYCPIDLYSGDELRMKHALNMLFAMPQNNMRIFKNGRIIWNDMIKTEHDNSEDIFLQEFFFNKDVNSTDSTTQTQDTQSLRCRLNDFYELLVGVLLHQFPSDYRPCPCNQADSTRTTPTPSSQSTLAQTTPTQTKPTTPTPTKTVIAHSKNNVNTSNSDTQNELNETTIPSQNSVTSMHECGLGVVNHRDLNKHGDPVNGSGHDFDVDPRLSPQECRDSTYRRTEDKRCNGRQGHDLPVGCVLHQVLQTQILDDLDIEGILPLYKLVKADVNEKMNKNGDDDPYQFAGPYSSTWWHDHQTSKTLPHNTLGYAVQKIKEFLVARSAKDCSIMISLQQLPAKLQADCLDKGTACHDDRAGCHGGRAGCQDPKSCCCDIRTDHHNGRSDCHDSTNGCHDNEKGCHENEIGCHDNDTGFHDSETGCHDSRGCCFDQDVTGHHRTLQTPPISHHPDIIGSNDENITTNGGFCVDKSCCQVTNHDTEQRHSNGFIVEDHYGNRHMAVVGVIDLDPKRFSKIPQYMAEDEAIVNCYLDRCLGNYT